MKKPGLLLSVIPIVLIIALLTVSVIVFGEDLACGASQISLLTGLIIISLIGIFYLKVPFEKIEEGIGQSIKQASGAIMILMMIGALTGAWMLSGVVPTMIYYGLMLIHPKVFILVTFVLCCLVSVLAGSSWTTVGTIGVAMLSASQIIGLPAGWVAGAIISGAYLGDKLSPLSDVVTLAAAVSGTDLYTHVKYSFLTAAPAFVICAIVYTIVGLCVPVASTVEMTAQMNALSSGFNISLWLLLIPAFTFFLVIKKVPATITLFLSAVVAALVTFIAQPQLISIITSGDGSFMAGFKAFVQILTNEITVATGDPLIDDLASTSGMAGMVNTIWLIICILGVGGALTATGMIDTITEKLLTVIKGTGSLIATTVCTCIVSNCVLADQYMSILLPGNMFKDLYRKKGLAPEVLSRTLGDSGTVSSVLVPWNTCALVQSSVLGIATMAYFPYAIFCFITPVIAIVLGVTGFKIHKLPVEEATTEVSTANN